MYTEQKAGEAAADCVGLLVQWSAVSSDSTEVTGLILTLCGVRMFCLHEFSSRETCTLEGLAAPN